MVKFYMIATTVLLLIHVSMTQFVLAAEDEAGVNVAPPAVPISDPSGQGLGSRSLPSEASQESSPTLLTLNIPGAIVDTLSGVVKEIGVITGPKLPVEKVENVIATAKDTVLKDIGDIVGAPTRK